MATKTDADKALALTSAQRDELAPTDVIPPRSVDEWVDLISEDYRKSVYGIVEVGKHLNQARAQIDRGNWGPFVARLPFSDDVAQRLMTIAKNEVLSNPETSRSLPPSWTALFELARVTDQAKLRGAIEHGFVKTTSTVKEVQQLVKKLNAPPPREPAPPPAPPETPFKLDVESPFTPSAETEPETPPEVKGPPTTPVVDPVHRPAQPSGDLAHLRDFTSQGQLIDALRRELPVFRAWYVSEHRQLESDKHELEARLARSDRRIGELERELEEQGSSSSSRSDYDYDDDDDGSLLIRE